MTPALMLNAGIRLSLLAVAVWLVVRIVRPRNPHVEALVWRMVLLAALLLPALLYFRVAPDFTTSLRLPVIAANGAGTAGVGAAAAGTPTRVLAAIYLAGASLLLLRLVAGLVGTWCVSRASARAATPDDVRISAHVRSPATFGSIVLLPSDAASWPAERLDTVLAHERAHVRSRDGYWTWLAQLHTALFWFSPFAWWLQRQLLWLAETTSDDAVVAARHDPVAYAELLLEFARNPNQRSVAMSVAESNVHKRIERLLALVPPARELPRLARWAAVALLVPVAVLAASTTRTATGSPHDPAQGVGISHFADPDDYYPAVALDERVAGFAVVEVDLDALGQLVDAHVVKVQPADARYGFADAALQVARNTQYRNTAQRPSTFRFMVKFALTDE